MGGGILEWWQRREWQRRTQWVLPDLLKRAMRETAIVASRSTAVLGGALGETERDSGLIADAFELPWTPVSDEVVGYVNERRERSLLGLFPDRTGAPASAVIPQADALQMEIEEHADKLWALSLELASYLDERRAPALLTKVAALHDAVRDFLDPFPERTVGAELWPLLAGMHFGQLLEAAVEVGKALSDAYDDAADRCSDHALAQRFAAERSERADADEGQADLIRALTEAEQLTREIDAGLAESTALMKRLSDGLDEIEGSAAPADEKLRRLDELLDELSEGPEEGEQRSGS